MSHHEKTTITGAEGLALDVFEDYCADGVDPATVAVIVDEIKDIQKKKFDMTSFEPTFAMAGAYGPARERDVLDGHPN